MGSYYDLPFVWIEVKGGEGNGIEGKILRCMTTLSFYEFLVEK